MDFVPEGTLSAYPTLTAFLTKIIEQGKYWDIHAGNVLKDEDDNYRLIDLEGFIRTPLTHHKNEWFLNP
jgi:hypothetical protein